MNLDQHQKLLKNIKNTIYESPRDWDIIYFVDDTFPFDIHKEYVKYIPEAGKLTCGSIFELDHNGGIYLEYQLHNYFINERSAKIKQRNRLFDYRARNSLISIDND